MSNIPPRLRIRLVFGSGARLGPGKADLLGAIGRRGSISAAGRELGMSYKRAWTLVEEMNATFSEPLVNSTRGGKKGGGARLTGVGLRVLTLYRRIEAEAASSGSAALIELQAMASDISSQE